MKNNIFGVLWERTDKMKKHIMFFVALICCIFVTNVQAATLMLQYDGETHEYTGSTFGLLVNNKEIKTSVEPLIFNEYALVPIREVFEAVGATVKYLDLSQQIFIEYNNIFLRLKIGSNIAYVDADEYEIPGGVTPMLIGVEGSDAKTMVPVRFVSESLGFLVDFDEESGTIIVEDPEFNKKVTLISYNCSVYDDLTVTMELKTDKELSGVSKPVYTDSNVLYFDVPNAIHNLNTTNEINTGAIKYLRVGMHDGFTRVALDLENCKSYSVTLASDKKTILIKVVSKAEGDDSTSPVNGGGKVVVIDAGHGGTDPGASGVFEGKAYKEKDINLSVALKVRDILEENNVRVLMTREGDTYPTLTERADFANINNAVIFTSIHSNSATTDTASGYEVYYSLLNNNETTGLSSKELAGQIISKLKDNINTRNRGVKTADHVVTRSSIMPAVLVEIGFMSNHEEMGLMLTDEFQNQFAKGIADGILAVIEKANPPRE